MSRFDNFFEQRACRAPGASAYANAEICWAEEMPSDIGLAIAFSLDGASVGSSRSSVNLLDLELHSATGGSADAIFQHNIRVSSVSGLVVGS
jgi:hypothetical protein